MHIEGNIICDMGNHPAYITELTTESDQYKLS